MNLFFETYLIITLLFTILTVCVAGLFLKSKKYTIGLSASVIILGALIPISLILLQKIFGSLHEIDWLIFADGRTTEEIADSLRYICIGDPPLIYAVFDTFARKLGFIIISIVIGIIFGFLVHLGLRKQKCR